MGYTATSASLAHYADVAVTKPAKPRTTNASLRMLTTKPHQGSVFGKTGGSAAFASAAVATATAAAAAAVPVIDWVQVEGVMLPALQLLQVLLTDVLGRVKATPLAAERSLVHGIDTTAWGQRTTPQQHPDAAGPTEAAAATRALFQGLLQQLAACAADALRCITHIEAAVRALDAWQDVLAACIGCCHGGGVHAEGAEEDAAHKHSTVAAEVAEACADLWLAVLAHVLELVKGLQQPLNQAASAAVTG